jgi:enolase-phosphatase E1
MNEMPVKTILLDIEGTTTPISFVYEILFPHARARLKDFLLRHRDDVQIRSIVADLLNERAGEENLTLPALRASKELDEEELEAVVSYCHRLMDEDRKVTALKTLQGKIWEEGYESGELKGEVFDDVAPNLRRWREQGKSVCIYSSGSVLAQRLLFAHTRHSDLTRLIDYFFDTTVGHKTEPESYAKIAGLLRRPAFEIMFISDVVAELDGAAMAGLRTLLCVRPGNHPQPSSHGYDVARTFNEILYAAA